MEKLKHNHKLTDILKVGIFGIMLTLPFMIVAPTGLYYGFNHQAQAQQKTEQKPIYYESNEVTQGSDIILNNIYNYNSIGSANTTGFIAKLNRDLVLSQLAGINNISSLEDEDNAYLYIGTSNVFIYFRETPQQYDVDIYKSLPNGSILNIIFEGIVDTTRYNNYLNENYTHFNESNYKFIREYVNETYTMSITDSMAYAWESTWQTPLFSWTNTSILKNGIDSFTAAFGVVDTSYITNFITYELIMVGIYIVIDIVIEMFKWMTHLIGNK